MDKHWHGAIYLNQEGHRFSSRETVPLAKAVALEELLDVMEKYGSGIDCKCPDRNCISANQAKMAELRAQGWPAALHFMAYGPDTMVGLYECPLDGLSCDQTKHSAGLAASKVLSGEGLERDSDGGIVVVTTLTAGRLN